MSSFALLLILCAAFVHASWNYASKRVAGGALFLWLVAAITSLLYLPVVLYQLWGNGVQLGWAQLGMILGSGIIHLFYFLALQRGYQVGDLSLVYPMARGTGPLLSTLAAIFFLGETPTALALFGAMLIVLGVFVISSRTGSQPQGNRHLAIGYGLLTGVLIAIYTIWDKQTVDHFAVPPVLLDYGLALTGVVGFAPMLPTRWGEVRQLWSDHRNNVLIVALFRPLSYILVLTAMQTNPVSYIAPAREISILIGTLMGARLLAEGDMTRRLLAAAAIVAGVVALAVG